MSGGPAQQELTKKKKEKRMNQICTYALGSFFFQPRMRKCLSIARDSFLFVFMFRFMAQEPFHLQYVHCLVLHLLGFMLIFHYGV